MNKKASIEKIVSIRCAIDVARMLEIKDQQKLNSLTISFFNWLQKHPSKDSKLPESDCIQINISAQASLKLAVESINVTVHFNLPIDKKEISNNDIVEIVDTLTKLSEKYLTYIIK